MQVTTFPQSYPQLPKSKKNPYFQLQGQKIKKIINQVNTILSHLLKDLEIIYKTNGLNYNIQHFYQTILRLLTPFQLLSHFHVIDNSDMFLGGNGREKDRFDFQMEYAQVGKVQNQYQDYNYRDSNKKDTKQSLKLIPTGYQAQIQHSSQFDQNKQHRSQKARKYTLSAQKAKKKRFYRRQMTKPILNPEIQCELVQWVFKKLNQNKRIRRKDIAQKALKLSGNQQGFQGSVGWVNRFLGRHKNLRQVLTKRAKGNLGRKPDVFSDQDDEQIDKLHANDLSYYTQNNSQTQNKTYSQSQNQLKQQYQQEHEQYQQYNYQDQSRNQSQNRNQNQNQYYYQNQNQIQNQNQNQIQYQRQKYIQNMNNKIKNQMINKNSIQNNRNNNTNGHMVNMNTNSYTNLYMNNVKNSNNGKNIYRI